MNAYVKNLGHLETTGALKKDIHDVQAAIAQVFALEGRVRIAVELFSDALHTAGNSQTALHETITFMMSTLVHSSGNRELRRQVCKMKSQPCGMGVFKDQLS